MGMHNQRNTRTNGGIEVLSSVKVRDDANGGDQTQTCPNSPVSRDEHRAFRPRPVKRLALRSCPDQHDSICLRNGGAYVLYRFHPTNS